MKAMILSDFLLVKKFVASGLIACGVVGMVVCLAVECSPWIIPFFSVFLSFFTATMLASTETAPWDRFRLTLPLTRAQVIRGRYVSILLYGLAAMFVGILTYLVALGVLQVFPSLVANLRTPPFFDGTGLTLASALAPLTTCTILGMLLPFVMQFGMIKAARIAPLALWMLLMLLFQFRTSVLSLIDTDTLTYAAQQLAALTETPLGVMVLAGALLAAASIIYLTSCTITARLYKRIDF